MVKRMARFEGINSDSVIAAQFLFVARIQLFLGALNPD